MSDRGASPSRSIRGRGTTRWAKSRGSPVRRSAGPRAAKTPSATRPTARHEPRAGPANNTRPSNSGPPHGRPSPSPSAPARLPTRSSLSTASVDSATPLKVEPATPVLSCMSHGSAARPRATQVPPMRKDRGQSTATNASVATHASGEVAASKQPSHAPGSHPPANRTAARGAHATAGARASPAARACRRAGESAMTTAQRPSRPSRRRSRAPPKAAPTRRRIPRRFQVRAGPRIQVSGARRRPSTTAPGQILPPSGAATSTVCSPSLARWWAVYQRPQGPSGRVAPSPRSTGPPTPAGGRPTSTASPRRVRPTAKSPCLTGSPAIRRAGPCSRREGSSGHRCGGVGG